MACGRLVAASPPLRALVSGAATGALHRADPETARLRLAGDVSELLATAARRRPVLLVLDDAHAADASSLRLLLETADAARTCPVLLLATARDDDVAWREGDRGRGDSAGDGRASASGSAGAGRPRGRRRDDGVALRGRASVRDDDGWGRGRGWARAQLQRRGRSLPLGPLDEQGGTRYCREPMRADIRDGAINEAGAVL